MKRESLIFLLRLLLIFLLFLGVHRLLERLDVGVVARYIDAISAAIAVLLGELFYRCFSALQGKQNDA